MGMLDANQCRSGTKLLLDGELYAVIERRHHKPGKGGALVRFKLKGIPRGGAASDHNPPVTIEMTASFPIHDQKRPIGQSADIREGQVSTWCFHHDYVSGLGGFHTAPAKSFFENFFMSRQGHSVQKRVCSNYGRPQEFFWTY